MSDDAESSREKTGQEPPSDGAPADAAQSDDHAVPPEELPAYRIKRPSGPPASGVLLVAIGVAWLLEGLEVVELDLGEYLAVALGAVGLTLLLSVRAHTRGGLVFGGLVLSLLVASGDAVGVGDGDFGSRVAAPATLDDLDEEYLHGTGELVLDLSELDEDELEDETDDGAEPLRVDMELGVGRLVVRTSEDVPVALSSDVSIGSSSASTVGGEALVAIDARVGIGSVRLEVVDR